MASLALHGSLLVQAQVARERHDRLTPPHALLEIHALAPIPDLFNAQCSALAPAACTTLPVGALPRHPSCRSALLCEAPATAIASCSFKQAPPRVRLQPAHKHATTQTSSAASNLHGIKHINPKRRQALQRPTALPRASADVLRPAYMTCLAHSPAADTWGRGATNNMIDNTVVRLP